MIDGLADRIDLVVVPAPGKREQLGLELCNSSRVSAATKSDGVT